MAEHTADTEQFPWSQHAPLTYRRFQLRNNFLLGTKNLVPNPFLIWSFYCTSFAHLCRRIYSVISVVYCFQIRSCTMILMRQLDDVFAQACSCSSSWPSWRLKTWRSGVVYRSSNSSPSSSPSAGSRCSSRRSSTFPVILAAWRHKFGAWSFLLIVLFLIRKYLEIFHKLFV